jgi:hypothetical protein
MLLLAAASIRSGYHDNPSFRSEQSLERFDPRGISIILRDPRHLKLGCFRDHGASLSSARGEISPLTQGGGIRQFLFAHRLIHG